ncbi:Calx-beta domain-containing protein [Luteolibacter luteus]|uniref:Calx-beta domain-containing protein n=1 Tax=Luteolibacter luteus TaxID=2728835 RepID=A0A858RJX6_9BACT|nr:Calx-beta domain-containing protein [Luteolibacter luteus]QJE96510.1 hypothetical protein HHL09_12205 [Luteolibacter luteus]
MGDRFAVQRIVVAQAWDGILFFNRNTFQQVGRVATTLRVQELVQRENDIVFTSRDGNGKFHIHRMAYPDFSRSDVLKMKITTLPGAHGWITFFGKDFAVTSTGTKHSIVRYSDPARNGKPAIYPLQESTSDGWIECGGKLARWSFDEGKLSTLEFGKAGYTLKPVGMPPGLHGSWPISTGPESIFFNGTSGGDWVHRIAFSEDRQLTLDWPVAEERDEVLRFTAKLEQAAAQPVTFSYETAGGSAISGVDFTSISGSATIAAGQSEVHIDVPLIEDYTIERPESLKLRITALQGALCDNPVTLGRIRGSGARLVEAVEKDNGGLVVGTLDTTTSTTGAVLQFSIGAATVEARQLGFKAFWPVTDAGDGFRYARALPMDSGTMMFCQFDGTSGELLEVFPHAPFKAQAGELTFGIRDGYVRYEFFDGLPLLSHPGIVIPEGPALKEIVVHNERTREALDLTAAWEDPLSTVGTPSLGQTPSGDIVLRISGGEQQPQVYDFTANLKATISGPSRPAGRTMLTPVVITENSAAAVMTFVPGLSFHGETLAASGNRVWTGQKDGRVLESFAFTGGKLSPGPKLTLPAGTKLRPDMFMDGFNENLAIATNGENVFAAAAKGTGKGFTLVSGANTGKPKGKHMVTSFWPTAQVASTNLLATSYGSIGESGPRRVEVNEIKTNKLLATLQSPTHGLFGFSLAISESMLWISSPHEGKVEGYDLTTFTRQITVTSPAPIDRAFFGYSVSAHGPYLVIGEASHFNPGAVWVFSADGTTLIKRLESGANQGRDGFGCQVATRNGRILVGDGLIDGQVGHGPIPDPGGHRRVTLWNSPTSTPVRLVSSFINSTAHDSGYAIALLDDCAVVAANSETAGSVEYYAFPQPGAAEGQANIARSAAGGTSTGVWPAEGAPAPVWSFTQDPAQGIEAKVDLGGVPSDPAAVVIEWSPDLMHWEPVADASGAVLAKMTKVSAAYAEEGILKVRILPEGAGAGFFRLRSKE